MLTRCTGIRITRALTCSVGALLAFTATAAAQQPLASWRFDDASGRVARDSGPLRLNGTLSAVGPRWIAGVQGSALRFDGTDVVSLPDSSALEPARMTVAAWVRHVGSPGTYRYVISKGSSSCVRSSYGLYTGSSGGMAFYIAGDGLFTVSSQAAPASVWDGRWHRVTGTYDGTRVRLFVDGQQIGTGASGPTHIEYGLASRAPYIGAYRGGCELPFAGDIDAVSLWGAALSAPQVGSDATPPPATSASGPIGRAPGAPPASEAASGRRTTPSGCTSVAVSRRSIRVARRARLVVTVRRGGKRVRGVRVDLKAKKLHKRGRTDRRGRARFVVRAGKRHGRITVRVVASTRTGCGRPVAYVRVRR